LQGFLESDQESLAGLHIGDLHFDERGTPSLIIGHHVLTGKVSSLDKPYAVMRKKRESLINDDEDDEMEIENGSCEPVETSYDVVAFVKQKIIFKNRPRPIILKKKPKTV